MSGLEVARSLSRAGSVGGDMVSSEIYVVAHSFIHSCIGRGRTRKGISKEKIK